MALLLKNAATVMLHDIIGIIFQNCQRFSRRDRSKGYGLPCAVKIFGFFCQKITRTSETDENLIQLALSVLHKALASAGSEIQHHIPLISFVKDDVCGAVIQRGRLVASNTSKTIVLALQLVRLLWINLRHVLKMQIEAIMNGIFIHALHWVIRNNSSTATEDLAVWKTVPEMMTCLVDLLSEATILSDLYVNYDCDDRSTTVTENLFELLSQVAELENEFVGTSAVDGLYSAVFGLYKRSDTIRDSAVLSTSSNSSSDDDESTSRFESAEDLSQRREQKKLNQQGTNLFNQKPVSGLRFLQQHGILPTPLESKQVASFLRSLPEGIDKSVVGAYLGMIGKEDATYEGDSVEFHQKVLTDYINSFSFKGHSLLDSLRMFLASFRLPGEAQQIDRILNAFSESVYQHCTDRSIMATCDVAYLLSFSIIMLNTDLHNPNIRPEKKMKLEDFHRNNRNYGEEVSRGQDLPTDFLDSIYFSIQENEIRTCSDDGASGEVTSDRWKDMVYQAESNPLSSRLIIHSSNGPSSSQTYHEQIYLLLWKHCITGFSVGLKSELTNQLACNGYIVCAAIASHFHLHDPFNSIFVKLCHETTIGTSEMEEYAQNRSAQLATAGLFKLVQTCLNTLRRDGWLSLMQCLIRLKDWDVLPHVLVDPDDFLTEEQRQEWMDALAERHVRRKTNVALKSNSSMFGTWAASFFKSTAPVVQETSPNEKEWMKKSLASYALDQLMTSSASIDLESLLSWIDLLLELIQMILVPKPTLSVSPFGSIFCQNTLNKLVCANAGRLESFDDRLYQHFAILFEKLKPLIQGNLIVNEMGYETASVLLDKAVVGLCHVMSSRQTYTRGLDLLLALDPALLEPEMPQLVAFLSPIVKTGTELESYDWILIFQLIQSVQDKKLLHFITCDSHGVPFDVLAQVVDDPITLNQLLLKATTRLNPDASMSIDEYDGLKYTPNGILEPTLNWIMIWIRIYSRLLPVASTESLECIQTCLSDESFPKWLREPVLLNGYFGVLLAYESNSDTIVLDDEDQDEILGHEMKSLIDMKQYSPETHQARVKIAQDLIALYDSNGKLQAKFLLIINNDSSVSAS